MFRVQAFVRLVLIALIVLFAACGDRDAISPVVTAEDLTVATGEAAEDYREAEQLCRDAGREILTERYGVDGGSPQGGVDSVAGAVARTYPAASREVVYAAC